jgi:hypothetical protein
MTNRKRLNMPSIITAYGYKIFFWSNENEPLEPIHVHIAKKPQQYATKIWIKKDGSCIIADNNSELSPKELQRLINVITENHELIVEKWTLHFGEITYYDD